MYADISVVGFNSNQNRQFSYSIPDKMDVKIGQIVELKFGKKTSLGVVRRLYSNKPKVEAHIQPILEVLPHAPIPKTLLELADWMVDYYVAPASTVWQMFLPKNPKTVPRKKFAIKPFMTTDLVELSTEQSRSLLEINKSQKPVLLEGVMGSGKTEIYFHIIYQALKKNKSALLLMPEIFLTNQMIERAHKHFGNKLLVTHSGLTSAQRRAVWDRCSSGETLLVLGPRSSLFSPLQNLGAIIVDECHEQSYKQDTSPRYLTEHVAAKLTKLAGAQLILGSATPSITTRYLADAGKITNVVLPERAIKSPHPKIEVTDLSAINEVLSAELVNMLNSNLDKKKLSLLYLNRRGTAPIFMCQDCDHAFSCPRCGAGLHFHSDSMHLLCHLCGFRQNPPVTCPECKSNNLRGRGIGTKALEAELIKHFPQAKIARIDKDSNKQSHLQDTLRNINQKKVDILIGTQMIGRGIDFEDLDFVGIVNADYDLNIIDFNSRERAFQLISQTAGRSGRRATQGRVVVQTKKPHDEFFSYIIANNYEGFYQSELSLRKKYSYPPFSYLLKLECGFVSSDLGKTRCETLINQFADQNDINILGPVSSYPSRRGRKHMWQVVLRCKSRKKLVEIAKTLEPFWIINLDPFGIL